MSLWLVGWFTTQSSIPVLHIVNLLSVAIVHRNLKCFPAFRSIQREIKRVFQLDLSCHFQQWACRLFWLANSRCVCCVYFLRFSVNRRIFVVGFGLYGSIHGPTDYQVNIQVWNKLLHSTLWKTIIQMTLFMFLLCLNSDHSHRQ